MGIRTNPKISTAYPTAGILTNLKARKTAEWLTATTTESATTLDIILKTQYGPRVLNAEGLFVSSDIDTAADIIWLKYGTVWDRLWTDYTAEYNPIWNVDGTETITETRDLTQTDKGTDSVQEGGSDSRANTGTQTNGASGTDTESISHGAQTHTQGAQSNTGQTGKAGINTATVSVTDTTSESIGSRSDQDSAYTDSDSTQYGRTDTRTDNLKEQTTYGRTQTRTPDLEHGETGTITTEHTRGGNIGVTMTQQMLEADLAYWAKATARFYDRVLMDIVNEFTYKIYTDTDESTETSTETTESNITITPVLTSGVIIATVTEG